MYVVTYTHGVPVSGSHDFKSECFRIWTPYSLFLAKGLGSSDNELLRLGRVKIHVVHFSPLLDIFVFVIECFYTQGAHQQIRIVGQFGQGILSIPGVEVRGRHHIRRWTNPRPLDDGRVNPGYEEGYFSCHGGMAPTLEVVHHPVVDVISRNFW